MKFINQDPSHELKEAIEFKVSQLQMEKEQYNHTGEKIVHEWLGHIYGHTRYDSKEPLHIKIAIDYDLASDTFGLSVRRETEEYCEGHPIESVHKLEAYQKLPMEDVINMGNNLNERLALEVLTFPNNTLEKTEIELDRNQKIQEPEIEL